MKLFFRLCLYVVLSSILKDISIEGACGDDGRMFDIVFIIDDSASVSGTEWNHQEQFLQYIIDNLEISSTKSLIGAIMVHDGVKEITDLGATTTNAAARSAVAAGSPRYVARSEYEAGVNYAINNQFANHRRSGSQGIIIGLSDDTGISSATMNSYLSTADSQQITLMMVGFDADTSDAARADYYWYAGATSGLTSTLAAQVAAKICPTCGHDGNKYDIIFALDYSGSLSTTDWGDQVTYANTIIDQMAVGSNDVLFGVVLVTNSYDNVFNLGTYTTGSATKSAIAGISTSPIGSSDYEQGAEYAYNTMIANYRRSGSTAVVIGLTDDHTGVASSFTTTVSNAYSNGDLFMVVGVDNSFSSAATSNSYYWDINDWNDLTTSMANSAAALVCPIDCGNPPSLTNGATSSYTSSGGGTATYGCNAGYDASTSPMSITCLASGWESITFTCNPKDCGSVPSVSDATSTTPGSTTYGSTATYTCNSGYTATSSTSITCQSSGSWSTPGFTCARKDCGNPSSISHSSYTNSGDTLYQSTATYACDSGFEASTNALTITCQSSGSWTSTSLVCNRVDCGNPSSISHSSYTNSGDTLYQSTATYACDSGFEASTNSLTITCQSTRSWTSTSLVCNRVDCGNPSSITHSSYTNSGDTLYQSTATYACDSGYVASTSALTVTCQASKSWSSTPLVCNPIDCGSVPTVADSSSSNTGTTYQSTATFTCDSNYVLSGSNPTTITCQASGNWETPTFSCIYDCGAPSSITDSSVTYTTTTDGSTATYACDTGYNPSTNALTITCNVGGWSSNAAITCIINDCSVPPDLSNAQKSYTTTTYLSTTTYSCDYGHNKNPSSSNLQIQCTPTTWETFTFSCDPNDCGTPSSVTNAETPSYTQTVYPYNASYTCSLGYHISDTNLGTIMCGPSTWDSITFTCDPNDCLTPPTLLNAQESYTTTTYLSTVTYSCDAGHDPSTSPLQITCEPFAWENITFSCIPKDCGTPGAVTFSTNEYTETIFYTVDTSTVQYTCVIGYIYDPESATGLIECQVTGVWSAVDFECIFNYCKDTSKGYLDPSALSVQQDNLSGQMYFLNDSIYTVDCCGVISGWEFEPEVEGFFNLMVWRPSGSSWKLVGSNSALITNSSISMNFTVPSNEKIAVQAKDQVGWYYEGGSMLNFDTCDPNSDPTCPQGTLHAPGPGDLNDNWVFDWESRGTALPNRAYAIRYYLTANTPLVFNRTWYNASVADHWVRDQPVLTVIITGIDYAESATYTMTPVNASLDYFYIDSFGTVKISQTLLRSAVVDTYQYNLTAVDNCQNFAWTNILINSYNSPPLFNNLPGKTAIEESIAANTSIFTVDVADPTGDPICCTIERVMPQTANFQLILKNTTLHVAIGVKPYFAYKDINSYLIRICCQDEEFGAYGILQVTVNGPEKVTSVATPGWFATALIASIAPISVMTLCSCTLLGYLVFGI